MTNTARSPPNFDGDKTKYSKWRRTFTLYNLQLGCRDKIGATSSPAKIGASSMTSGTLTRVRKSERTRNATLPWTALVDAVTFSPLVNKIFDKGSPS